MLYGVLGSLHNCFLLLLNHIQMFSSAVDDYFGTSIFSSRTSYVTEQHNCFGAGTVTRMNSVYIFYYFKSPKENKFAKWLKTNLVIARVRMQHVAFRWDLFSAWVFALLWSFVCYSQQVGLNPVFINSCSKIASKQHKDIFTHLTGSNTRADSLG